MTASSSRSPLALMALLVAPLLLALAACATPFNANVKRFSNQMPPPSGQTFAIVPENPRDAGGIEFGQYADLLAAKLSQIGYVRTDPGHASMLVRFGYDVDRGHDRLRTTGVADPFWGSWYGPRVGFGGGFGGGFYGRRHFGGWGYGWYDPFFFDNGYDVDVVTVYTSEISVIIERQGDGQRLFEGRAQAASRSNRLGYLIPNLIEAMFTGFPGNSGETVRISIAPEKTTVKHVD
jgi:hypothetical protein